MEEQQKKKTMSTEDKKVLCYQELDRMLEASHISVTDGYHYAGESMGIFHWMLRIFAESFSDKYAELEQAYRQFTTIGENKEAYTVAVHSLKSNARSIGANRLADLSYEHERRSRDGETDFVNAHWEELQQEWLAVVNGIWRYFGEDLEEQFSS